MSSQSVLSNIICEHLKLSSKSLVVYAYEVASAAGNPIFIYSRKKTTIFISFQTAYSDEATSLAGDRQVYAPCGFYKGCRVAIKKVDKQRIDLTRPLLLELKKMKDLEQDHLARFYGACVDPPHCCLLTEYCPKGSLQDILENEAIKLDWMFKVSLMHDIVRVSTILIN